MQKLINKLKIWYILYQSKLMFKEEKALLKKFLTLYFDDSYVKGNSCKERKVWRDVYKYYSHTRPARLKINGGNVRSGDCLRLVGVLGKIEVFNKDVEKIRGNFNIN